jgi:hypothetical protein
MSIAKSFTFEEGRETIETPSVSTTRQTQRLRPSVRPRRTTLKNAVVMI